MITSARLHAEALALLGLELRVPLCAVCLEPAAKATVETFALDGPDQHFRQRLACHGDQLDVDLGTVPLEELQRDAGVTMGIVLGRIPEVAFGDEAAQARARDVLKRAREDAELTACLEIFIARLPVVEAPRCPYHGGR